MYKIIIHNIFYLWRIIKINATNITTQHTRILNTTPIINNNQSIDEYIDQLYQIICTNLDKCELYDNEKFLNTALCAIKYLNNNKALPEDIDNIDWLFFDQILEIDVPKNIEPSHFAKIIKFIKLHAQSNLFLQKKQRTIYKLGNNILIEQGNISDNNLFDRLDVRLDQVGQNSHAFTKSLDLIKYEIERLELEDRIDKIRSNQDRYDNKDKKFYNAKCTGEELIDTLKLNSKTMDCICKTIDDKYYYIIEGKAILLGLKTRKNLPSFKDGEKILYKQIQALFDEFEIMSPLKKLSIQLAELSQKYQYIDIKYQEGLEEFEKLATNPNTNKLIRKWCLGSNAFSSQYNFELLSISYAVLYQVFCKINTIERSLENEISGRALRGLLLFGTDFNCKVTNNLCISSLKRLADFISSNAANLLSPIHDIFQHEIPSIELKNVTQWKKKIQGSRSTNSLGLLAIKALRSANKLDIENINNLDDLNLLLTKITYSNIPDEYQNFAQTCVRYAVPEPQWNSIMQYEKTLTFAKQNKLPNIKLITTAGVTFSKLDPTDKNAYILGNIVGCCMHISGNSEQCVIDGMTLENNGFYVLRNKRNEIIGAIYAWISIAGNICFDSIEVHPRYYSSIKYKTLINNLLYKAAKVMLEYFPEISQINIGCGGGTAHIVNILDYVTVQSNSCELMLNGYNYGDSLSQIIYAKNLELTRLQKDLQGLIGLNRPLEFHCNSIQAIHNYMFFKYKYPENKNIQLFALIGVSLNKLYEIVNNTKYNEMLAKFGYSYSMALYMIYGWSHIEDLLENNNKILEIESSNDIINIIGCLDHGFIKASDLKDRSLEIIKVLTSVNFVFYYRKGYCTFVELQDKSTDVINALTSESAEYAFIKEYCPFEYFKDKSPDVIEALTSNGAVICYEGGYCKFDDLKDKSPDVIEALTSADAIKCYERGYCKFDDLKDKSFDEINALTSCFTVICYERGYCKFDDLKDKSPEVIEALTSCFAVSCYEKGYCKFDDLKDKSPDVIKSLTSSYAQTCYEKGYCTFASLENKTSAVIEALTSSYAQTCYEKGYCTFASLENKTSDVIKALTSSYAQTCYEKGYCTFASLENKTSAVIEALTSFYLQTCYEKGYCTFANLEDKSLDEINALTSWPAILSLQKQTSYI